MRAITVEWGDGRREEVSSVAALDALLDRIEHETRVDGRPQNVELVGPAAEGRLHVVVGGARAVARHTPADVQPPYRIASGGEGDEPFVFYVAGDHHTEVSSRHTIEPAQARDAARLFFLTGRLDDRLEWREV